MSNSIERYELIASLYRKRTGRFAPGKCPPMGYVPPLDEHTNSEAWESYQKNFLLEDLLELAINLQDLKDHVDIEISITDAKVEIDNKLREIALDHPHIELGQLRDSLMQVLGELK